jgi:hypothetical protein
MTSTKPQLFHAIADAGSAKARALVVERGLQERVQFRNVHYEEVVVDLRAHGGGLLPAIWDGAKLYEGEAAVLGFLAAL